MNGIQTEVNFDPSNSFAIHILQYSNWEFWKTGKTVVKSIQVTKINANHFFVFCLIS